MKKDIIPYQRRKELARLEQEEVVEGKLVEDKRLPAGRGSGFRSELAKAASEIDAVTGMPKESFANYDYWGEPESIAETNARKQREAKALEEAKRAKKRNKQLPAPTQPQLPAPQKTGWLSGLLGGGGKEHKGTLRLPSGETVEFKSKAEEDALIKRYWG